MELSTSGRSHGLGTIRITDDIARGGVVYAGDGPSAYGISRMTHRMGWAGRLGCLSSCNARVGRSGFWSPGMEHGDYFAENLAGCWGVYVYASY